MQSLIGMITRYIGGKRVLRDVLKVTSGFTSKRSRAFLKFFEQLKGK
jgi:hypothetical protein